MFLIAMLDKEPMYGGEHADLVLDEAAWSKDETSMSAETSIMSAYPVLSFLGRNCFHLLLP